MIRVTNMMRSTDIHCHSRLSLSVFNPSSPVHCQHVYGSTLDSRMIGAVTYGEGAGSESVKSVESDEISSHPTADSLHRTLC